MESINASSSLYSALWLGQSLDLHLLSPSVRNAVSILASAQLYTWLQTLFVTVLLALIYYYVVLPMNYVKVSHNFRIAYMWLVYSHAVCRRVLCYVWREFWGIIPLAILLSLVIKVIWKELVSCQSPDWLWVEVPVHTARVLATVDKLYRTCYVFLRRGMKWPPNGEVMSVICALVSNHSPVLV